MWKIRSVRIGLVCTFMTASLVSLPAPAQAAGVVGNGSPASCNAVELSGAVAAGGLVTFNCGPDPHTINLTNFLEISANTEIQGGGLITLSGVSSTPHFQIYTTRELVLRDITLTAGSGTFGSIQNFGTLRLFNVRMLSNTASVSGGGIENYGTVEISGSLIGSNSASMDGGGIFNEGGTVNLVNSQVRSNQLTHPSAYTRGGGIYNGPGSQLTIQGGDVTGNHAGANGPGGGIYNAGELTANDLEIAENWAFEGLGLFSLGTTSLTNTHIRSNQRPVSSEPSSGGGILVLDGMLTGVGLTIEGNHALLGGGLTTRPKGRLRLTRSYIAGNSAQQGGGLLNYGSAEISESALVNNTAEKGGAIYANELVNPGVSAIVLVNTTIAENTTTDASATGAIHDNAQMQFRYVALLSNPGPAGLYVFQQIASPYLQNTLIAGHTSNCAGAAVPPVTSGSYNLSSDNSCGLNQSGDRNNLSPMLAPLSLTGAKRSSSPLPGSPLIDAAPCLTGIPVDQRGTSRPQDQTCEIGPVEYLPENAGLTPAVFIPLALN